MTCTAKFLPRQHPSLTPIPAFSDNYIWALHDTSHAIIVDPGDAAPVKHWLGQTGLQLAAILITHHHMDHIGGIHELLQSWQVPVIGPHSDRIDQITQWVDDGDDIVLPGLNAQARVLAVPGHTLDHIAYVVTLTSANSSSILFCGDTLFAAGCGRIFEGTAQQMWESLQKLAALPEDTFVCCAHEYTSGNLAFGYAAEPHNAELASRIAMCDKRRSEGLPTLPCSIADEHATNPFLRASLPQLAEHLPEHLKPAELSAVQCFAALRRWKDEFRPPARP